MSFWLGRWTALNQLRSLWNSAQSWRGSTCHTFRYAFFMYLPLRRNLFRWLRQLYKSIIKDFNPVIHACTEMVSVEHIVGEVGRNRMNWFTFDSILLGNKDLTFSTIIEGLSPISITLTAFNFLLSNRLSLLHFMAVLERGHGWLCIVTNEWSVDTLQDGV